MHCTMALALGAFTGLVKATFDYSYVYTDVSELGQLNSTYDFIIVGGGQAGLTVADRLTEKFPTRKTLVIEVGDYQYAPAYNEPPDAAAVIDGIAYTSVAMSGINDRTYDLSVGRAVGGSTTINGQFLDRGGSRDYDAWKTLQGDEFSNYTDVWDWEGLLPYFKKSVTFTEPDAEQIAAYNFTYDVDAAYGGSTPVDAYFAPYQWEVQKYSHAAWEEMGSSVTKDCAAGEKLGTCWIPITQDPVTAERSHAGVGHFEAVIANRTNYHLLVLHSVNRVLFPNGLSAAPSVEVVSNAGAGKTYTIHANKEVILAAGAVNTPLILQRSGIGAKATLEEAGITPRVDLPGVGQNFHDHPYVYYGASTTNTPSPDSSELDTNETFLNWAIDVYADRPARGPYTLAQGNSGVFLPLSAFADDAADISAALREQVSSGDYVNYLPEGTDETVLAGYKAMLSLNADMLDNDNVAALEAPAKGLASLGVILRPASRGYISVNPDNVTADPIVDFGTISNPTDLSQLINIVPFFRKFYQTSAIQDTLGPVYEFTPGAAVTSQADLEEHVRSSVVPGFAHPCCTASMLPKSLGGVVAPDMKVHGVGRLSVVDLSVCPILPGTHTMATVYAIAEKAAEIIAKRYSACSQ